MNFMHFFFIYQLKNIKLENTNSSRYYQKGNYCWIKWDLIQVIAEWFLTNQMEFEATKLFHG
jgi:hypothetical protein